MNPDIPSAADVQALLKPLTLWQLDELSRLSGVPVATIAKVRYGATENPGIDTVRKFLPHIAAAGEALKAPA